MKRVSRIRGIVGLVAIAGIVVGVPRLPFLSLGSKTAYAVGDLSIDWGVPSGDPIFTVPAMAPGDVERRVVTVTNSASTARPIGVRGVLTTSSGGLADVLEITIAADGTDLYGGTSGTGPKTLTTFFVDSAGPSGISLLTLGAGKSTTLTFTIAFLEAAGNELQGTSVVLDITIGLSVETPAACAEIPLDGSVIFGTERGDRLEGTGKNDLIVAFEGGDRVRGGEGRDCILGGPGGDRLEGDEGDDVIEGGSGGDNLRGGGGDDDLDGGPGGDVMRGGPGEDHLAGGPGSDRLRGGGGDDDLSGDEGSDTARGGPGTDTCDAEMEIGCEL